MNKPWLGAQMLFAGGFFLGSGVVVGAGHEISIAWGGKGIKWVARVGRMIISSSAAGVGLGQETDQGVKEAYLAPESGTTSH